MIEFTAESVKVLLEDFPKLALVRKAGNTTIVLNGEQLATYDDYTVKGYTIGGRHGKHGVEFIPKGFHNGP